jgi:hypothetical protein
MSRKPQPSGRRSTPSSKYEVDVVDRRAVLVAIDEVQDRAADAADRRQLQLHRPAGYVDRLRAVIQGQRVGRRPRRARGTPCRRRWAVLLGVVLGRGMRLVVGDEVDVALAPQVDVLGLVPGHERKPIISNTGSSTPRSGAANSTNSKPSRPMGLSKNRSVSLLSGHARVVLPVLSCPRCLARIVGRRRCHRRVHRARPRAGKARGATVQGRGAQSLSKYAGQISSICCALWANKAGFNQLYANLR